MVNPCTGVEEYFPGESFDDFNNSGSWDDFVQPKELALYWQNTFERPWIVINAGVRVDAVNYQTKIGQMHMEAILLMFLGFILIVAQI
jgi:hypothetical protein